MASELGAYLRHLHRDGYQVTKSRSSHWHVRDPHGRLVAVTGSTPGDRRALANLRAAVNRARRPA